MYAGEEPPGDDQYRRMLDRVSAAVISLDTECQVTYLNDAAEALVGEESGGVAGRPVWEVLPGATEAEGRAQVETALESQCEQRYAWTDESTGERFGVRAHPGQDGLTLLIEDDPDWADRRAELERYEWIVENLPVGVIRAELGRDGGVVYANDDLGRMIGESAVASSDECVVRDHCADPQAYDRFIEEVQHRGTVTGYELNLRSVDGETVRASVTATVDGDDHLIGIVRDISYREEHERKLGDLHDATQEMLSASTQAEVAETVTTVVDHALEYDMSGVHRYDESADALVPVSISEEIRQLIGEVPALDEGIAWEAYQTGETRGYDDASAAKNLFNDETPFGSGLAVPLGEYGTLIVSASEVNAFSEADRHLIEVLANNAAAVMKQLRVKHRLQSQENELRRNRDFLEQTARVAKLGGWEVDLRDESIEWTDQVYRIYDLPVGETPSLDQAFEVYHPEDREVLEAAWERLTEAGEPFDLELRVETGSGTTKWVRMVGIPEYGTDCDEVVAAQGIIQNVTERKEREEEIKQQNERLSEFASVISHDLRNPLTVARGRTALLRESVDDDDHRADLQTVADSLARMEDIIDDTLTLARKGDTVGELQPVDLADLVGECWEEVATATASVEVTDRMSIRADEDRLRHVFENLFRNAVEHGGSDVTVRVGRLDENGFYVEDDGVGIPSDDREDVFEVGVTSTHDGTGFGLPIVKRIAEAHGWTVTATGGPDGGARFEFDGVDFVETE